MAERPKACLILIEGDANLLLAHTRICDYMDRDVIEICSDVYTNSEQQIHLLFTMNNTPSLGHSRERVNQRELWEGKMQYTKMSVSVSVRETHCVSCV